MAHSPYYYGRTLVFLFCFALLLFCVIQVPGRLRPLQLLNAPPVTEDPQRLLALSTKSPHVDQACWRKSPAKELQECPHGLNLRKQRTPGILDGNLDIPEPACEQHSNSQAQGDVGVQGWSV